MRMKTYLCPSMTEAMNQIRRELGPDAIIISTFQEGDNVRVTAASDYEAPPAAPTEARTPTVTPMQVYDRFRAMLTFHGTPADIAQMLYQKVSSLPNHVLEQGLPAILEKTFRLKPGLLEFQVPQNPVVLMGPPGVGKTVTLVKLATELLIQNKPVQLVTCDILKAGAIGQLNTFANKMQVPFYVAQTPAELKTLLAQKPENTYLLIDTPGMNPFHQEDLDRTAQLILTTKQPPWLVMSAGGDPLETLDHLEIFKQLGPCQMLMTRLDLAKRLGSLLSILAAGVLDLKAISMGPQISNRLKALDSSLLRDILVSHIPDSTSNATAPTPSTANWFQHLKEVSR